MRTLVGRVGTWCPPYVCVTGRVGGPPPTRSTAVGTDENDAIAHRCHVNFIPAVLGTSLRTDATPYSAWLPLRFVPAAGEKIRRDARHVGVHVQPRRRARTTRPSA
jgi:hypothetical protein